MQMLAMRSENRNKCNKFKVIFHMKEQVKVGEEVKA